MIHNGEIGDFMLLRYIRRACLIRYEKFTPATSTSERSHLRAASKGNLFFMLTKSKISYLEI